MASWISRIFGRFGHRSIAPPSGQAEFADGQGEEEDAPPAWAEELGEMAQKVSRAMVRLSVRVEELERKVEGGFADLRAREQERRQPVSPPSDLAPLLDALDLIDDALRALPPEDGASLGQGLRGIAARLERYLKAAGVRRFAAVGVQPDGRLFRVVGAADYNDLPEGAVVRVVRAAALVGDQVLREGEVVVARRMA